MSQRECKAGIAVSQLMGFCNIVVVCPCCYVMSLTKLDHLQRLSRPVMTYAVDCALKANYLSLQRLKSQILNLPLYACAQ